MNSPRRSIRPAVLVRFGKAVRARRHELSLSQEALASACGLDRSYMGGVERGQRNVSLVNVELIAVGLELTMAELLCRAAKETA